MLLFAADSAPYHKSGEVDRYMESTNGDVRLLFLPKHTSQLNPRDAVANDQGPACGQVL